MSDVTDLSAVIVATSASTGALAVAAAIAEQHREEEVMTPYTAADLAEGWEFKILRARGPKFADAAKLGAALADEARAQWVLVEKFDDARLRFKRPASAKSQDGRLDFDPYRTRFGVAEDRRTIIVTVVVTFAIVGAVLGGLFYLVTTQTG